MGFSKLRSAGGVAVDAPVLLCAELRGRVLLPQVVVRVEQDQVAGKRRLQRRNRLLLLIGAGDGLAVRGSFGGPARLGDDGRLATGRCTDLLCPVKDEFPRTAGFDVAVEEGVAVDGAVVGGRAQLNVREHGNHGVDRNDGSIVASFPERVAGLVHSTNDLVD